MKIAMCQYSVSYRMVPSRPEARGEQDSRR